MDTSPDDFNVDEQRDEHESDKVWQMRRAFLVANMGLRTPERLICLANCYVNMEVDGCSYPIAVMQEVRELADRIPEQSADEPLHEAPKRAKYGNAVQSVKQKGS